MKKIRILVSNLTEKTVSFFAKAKKRIAAHVRGFLAHTKAAVSAGASALGTLKKKSGRKKKNSMSICPGQAVAEEKEKGGLNGMGS